MKELAQKADELKYKEDSDAINMKLGENFNTKQYNTLDLIENLRSELRNYPEILAKLFPERLKKYSHNELSRMW